MIDRAKILDKYMKWVNEVSYQCPEKAGFYPAEIVNAVCDIVENELKSDLLNRVSVPFPSDELIEERGKDFESKTYYNLEEGENIGDFEVGAKWVVDYLKGNER